MLERRTENFFSLVSFRIDWPLALSNIVENGTRLARFMPSSALSNLRHLRAQSGIS